jgi:hypothetical protein
VLLLVYACIYSGRQKILQTFWAELSKYNKYIELIISIVQYSVATCVCMYIIAVVNQCWLLHMVGSKTKFDFFVSTFWLSNFMLRMFASLARCNMSKQLPNFKHTMSTLCTLYNYNRRPKCCLAAGISRTKVVQRKVARIMKY